MEIFQQLVNYVITNKDNISDYATCKDYKNRKLNVIWLCFTESLIN